MDPKCEPATRSMQVSEVDGDREVGIASPRRNGWDGAGPPDAVTVRPPVSTAIVRAFLRSQTRRGVCHCTPDHCALRSGECRQATLSGRV